MAKKIYNLCAITFLIFPLISLSGCDRMGDESSEGKVFPGLKLVGRKSKARTHSALWERIRSNYVLLKKRQQHQPLEREKIQRFVNEFSANEAYLARVTLRASPYLHFIVEELEKRDMPGELALLPIIESAYQPHATSRKGAAGLWQFIPCTGREFGLVQDKWYDGRRDVIASTRAALDYLQFLHKEFDGNWMLALAAYNAGPGAVHRAIKKNLATGKPTNFWALKLPRETQYYVPRLLALAEVIGDPNKHEVSLAHIENKPYFAAVDTGKHVSLIQVAKLADINLNELKLLNAGYRRASTHPTKGPKRIILPVFNAEKLEDNLASLKSEPIPRELPAVVKKKVLVKAKPKARGKVLAKAKPASRAKVPAKPKVKVG